MTVGALSVRLAGDDASALRATRSFEQQGFVCALRDARDGIVLQVWTSPAHMLAIQSAQSDFGMATCVGPLFYRDRFGKAALQLLLEEIQAASAIPRPGTWNPIAKPDGPCIDETRLQGNFALFVRAAGRCWLLNDSLGLVRIYCSPDSRFYSTSWLAARAYAGHTEIDQSAAVHYVLLGATHSERTVARGVTKLAFGAGLDLAAHGAYRRFPSDIVPARFDRQHFASISEAVDAISDQLRSRFRNIAAAFPHRTSAALSGGFDSRLILAALLAQGEQPHLFVYGGPESGDVPIARQIAQASITLDVVDKDAMNRALPQPTVEDLVGSALFFDGLPNDGIHDPGADRLTRLDQSAGGKIALNGGGGEIFRNFFHLPDRRFSPFDVVHAFYRGFDARVFRHADGLSSFEWSLAQSIARAIGLPALEEAAYRRISREQVELIYPLFRCHHWMGANNSVSVRIGNFATPLIDLHLVRQTFNLPLRWKHAGLFESKLIAALHQGVASQASVYGFRFSDGPNMRAMCNERMTNMRPVSLRPMINMLRRKLYRERVSPGLAARWRAMLPGEWRVDSVLDLNRLPANGAFERALSIEVVSRELRP